MLNNFSRGSGIKGYVKEGGNKEKSTCSRKVFEQRISCVEQRQIPSICNQSKNVEPVRFFSPFQNGRPFSVKALNTREKLDVQTGPEGCILHCPLDWSSKKFARLHRNGTLYEFMWLCFGLGPAHRVFTKLLKIPISLLRKLNIRIIIYLEDMLILSHTIYAQIWVEVRSYISCRICLYNIYKEINFSPITKKNNISGNGDRFNQNGFSIDTREGKKIWNLLRSHPTTLLELIRVIGLLSSIIQAVEPAKIQQGFL